MRRLLAGLAVLAAAAPLPFQPEEALLALDDLPAGWVEDPDEDDGDEGEFCGRSIGVDPLARAETAFAEGGGLPILAGVVAAYAPGDARAAIGEFREIAAGCEEFEDDGDEFRLAPSSFPEVGEESVPILVTADVDGVTISFYVVAIRVADGVAQVGYGGLDPDVAEAARFARLAAGKLAAAQE